MTLNQLENTTGVIECDEANKLLMGIECTTCHHFIGQKEGNGEDKPTSDHCPTCKDIYVDSLRKNGIETIKKLRTELRLLFARIEVISLDPFERSNTFQRMLIISDRLKEIDTQEETTKVA